MKRRYRKRLQYKWSM